MPDHTIVGTSTDEQEPSAFIALPRLRGIREHAGLSRAQLARMTGSSKATIMAAEDGTRTPHLMTARRIAEALGVPLADLAGESA